MTESLAGEDVVPFWHGFHWEPLPVAPWTQWQNVSSSGEAEDESRGNGARPGGGAAAPAATSLNEMIHEERTRLKQLPGRYLPYLRGLRDNLRRLIRERLDQPHHRVFRVHHERLVREVEARIHELRTFRDLRDFEANIQPYVLAHAALVDGVARELEAEQRDSSPAAAAAAASASLLAGTAAAGPEEHRFVHSELSKHYRISPAQQQSGGHRAGSAGIGQGEGGPPPAAAAAAAAASPFQLAPQQLAAMSPIQQRLYQRMLNMVAAREKAVAEAAAERRGEGQGEGEGEGAAAQGFGGAGGARGEGGLPGAPQGTTGDLVRHMFSRLWGEHHAPANASTTAQDLCERCGRPMVKSIRDMMLVCSSCGSGMAYLDSTEATRTYGDDVEFILGSSSRYNHWQEFLTRAQAREITAVPLSVLSKVARALRSVFQVGSAAEVTLDKVVHVVRELNLREYKKNVCQICARLSGVWPVQLTAEQLFIAKGMFFEVLNAFEQLYPGEKKFFRQRYVTLVICTTMGWDEMVRTLEVMEGAPAAAAAAGSGGENGTAGAGAAPPPQQTWLARSNIPLSFQRAARSEIEESEIRMRAIFRHLGWIYRGPYCGILPPDASVAIPEPHP
jgi:ribosomal protein L37AE/L43A